MNPVALKTAAKTGYPARQDPRRVVGGLGGGRHSGGRRCQGLHQRGVFGVGHEFPGDPGHQEEGLRRRQGQPRGHDAHRQRSITRAASSTASSSSRRFASRRPSSARARSMTPEQVRWGLENLQPHRGAPQGAGRRRPLPADQDELRRPRGLGHGEVPAMGRQGVQALIAVHGGRPRAWCARWSRRPRQVRGRKEDHAARLQQGRLIALRRHAARSRIAAASGQPAARPRHGFAQSAMNAMRQPPPQRGGHAAALPLGEQHRGDLRPRDPGAEGRFARGAARAASWRCSAPTAPARRPR